MAKANREVLEVEGKDANAYVVVEQPLDGRRWLTAEHRRLALEALTKRLKRSKKTKEDDAEDDAGKWWAIAGDAASVSWDALRRRLDRSWNYGSRTWKSANDLAAALLGKKVEDITKAEPPPGRKLPANKRGPRLNVSYPTRIADHRAVIVGEIPPDLHPAVFIKPDVQPGEGETYWYPQFGTKRKHNPLRIGAAFACFAHFGNPNWIGHVEKSLMYHVRVYALEEPWPYNSNRLSQTDLDEKIAALKPHGHLELEVERSSPVVSVTVTDHAVSPDRKKPAQWFQRMEKIPCSAPVQISWEGPSDMHIEIRRAVGDEEVVSQLVGNPVALTLPGCPASRSANHLPLPGPDLYRVRLYPLRYAFVDPIYEWWLDVSLHETDRPRSNGGRRRSPVGNGAKRPQLTARAR